MTADRSGLLGADVATGPLLARRGPGAVSALWTQMQHQVATQSYADVFLLLGPLTVLGVAVALMTLPGRSRPAAAPAVTPGAARARLAPPVVQPAPAPAPEPVLAWRRAGRDRQAARPDAPGLEQVVR